MSCVHILRTPSTTRPWWRTDERFPEAAGGRIWTDCCCCKVDPAETESRIVESYEPPHGDDGFYPDPWQPEDTAPTNPLPTGAYFEPRIETRCAEGFGCSASPRKRWGRALRECWRHPA